MGEFGRQGGERDIEYGHKEESLRDLRGHILYGASSQRTQRNHQLATYGLKIIFLRSHSL